MKVAWKNNKSNLVKRLYFSDLNLGDTFRNKHGRGAVYAKVQVPHTGDQFMFEFETGKLFAPTTSELELVDVSVNVEADKPVIYR